MSVDGRVPDRMKPILRALCSSKFASPTSRIGRLLLEVSCDSLNAATKLFSLVTFKFEACPMIGYKPSICWTDL